MGKPDLNQNEHMTNPSFVPDPNFVTRGQRIQSSIKEYNNCSCNCQFKDVLPTTHPKLIEDEESSDNLGKKKKIGKYKKILKKFADNTTAHGFGQIINTKSKPIKLFWVITMIVAFVVLCINIQPLFTKYLSKPTITKIKVQTDRQPNFPVIVICNQNMVKDEKYKELLLQIGETEESIKAWEAMLKVTSRRKYGHLINETIQSCHIHHDIDCTPTGNSEEDAKKGN